MFDGTLGWCNKTKAHLNIKDGCRPIFRPKRPVAYAVQADVEKQLKMLQASNVISSVNYSEWAAPIVVVRKPNNGIRICADFSTGLNAALEQHQYPLPLSEDIFARLANATRFSHIDLADAFLQIEMDDESKQLLTINTHLGLFRYNRMAFGVKTFPAMFQQIMDEMIAGLDFFFFFNDEYFIDPK